MDPRDGAHRNNIHRGSIGGSIGLLGVQGGSIGGP
jgi:hypothetical protein